MTFVQPLDLYYWLVTTFAGSLTIFLALAFLGIAGMAALFRMPNLVVITTFALFVVMLSAYTGTIFILVTIVTGFVVFWTIARLFK